MNDSNPTYSVNVWGSHPDDGNDDCWNGDDFASLAEAEAEFAKDPDCDSHDQYVELAVGTRDGRRMVDVESLKVRKVAGRKGSYIGDTSDDDEWRREQAMQAGMGMGVDAYNDMMGY